MAKKKMSRQQVFLIWSMLLVAGGFMAVWKDFNPPWKAYQQEFQQVTLDLAQEKIDRENQKIRRLYEERLETINRRIRARIDETRSLNHQQRIEEKKAEIARLANEEYLAGQQLSFAKSRLSAARSQYEFLKNDPHAFESDIEAAKQEYEKLFQVVEELTPIADRAYAELTRAKEELKELERAADDLIRERDQILAEKKAWEAEVAKIKPEDIVEFTAYVARDLPLADWIDPKYNLKQTVLPDLPDLTDAPKVDRCTTCHLGIADPGYADADVEQPFRAHPNLDLYVGRDSPHPVEEFGCTVCHQGRGYGTSFASAAHMPSTPEQEEQWREKYGWDEHDYHYWDFPMLPRQHYEAMCFNCHKSQMGTELTMARNIYLGREIYERRGCHGCHKIEGVSDELGKVGPSLEMIASKLDREWTPRWLRGPRDFYESARMPHPFGHQIPSEETFPEYVEEIEAKYGEGHFDEEYREMKQRDAVVIEAITTFLYDRSEEMEMDPLPEEPGDPEIGRQLVATLNCLGCHSVGDLNAQSNGYGPELSKVGTKTNAQWIYNWIRDPKKYWPEGNMPDPRVTDEEANHITAYLMTLRDEEYMQKPIAKPTGEDLDKVAFTYLRSKNSVDQANEKLAGMTEYEKNLYVGEEAVYRYGCFGCHDIKGFENRGRIGVELTAEGFKEIERFDFGTKKYVHLLPFRHEWIERKVKQPYVFFLGKVLNPYEQTLYMPWFGFSDEEADAITSFVLAQTGNDPPPEYAFAPTGEKAAILEGRKILERKNCQGCHKIGLGEREIDAHKFNFRDEVLWVTDPVVAQHDPALPEGKYVELEQVKPGKVDPKDKVILKENEFIDGEAAFGEDYYTMNDLFGPDDPDFPVTVDIGAESEVEVALRRPRRLKVMGVDEGRIMEHYDERAMAPPILRNEGAKVRPDWLFAFLKNVETIRNHIEVRMPQWDWTDEEATKVVKYFAAAAGEPFPFETENIQPLGEIHRQTAENIFGLPGTEGYSRALQCFSCHPAGELKPTSPRTNWGPDLYMARDRLKQSFIKSFLTDPPSWAPGTRMPSFFYQRDGRKLVAQPPNDAVAEIGVEETIDRLAEVLYYLPQLEEVKLAAQAAAEAQKAEPEPTPAPEFEDFEGFDDFQEFEEFEEFEDFEEPQPAEPDFPAFEDMEEEYGQ